MNAENRQLSVDEQHRLNLNQSTAAELDNMVNIINSMDFSIRDAEQIYRTLFNIDNYDADVEGPFWLIVGRVYVPLHPVEGWDTAAYSWQHYEKGSYQAKLLTMIEYINSLRSLTGKRTRKGKRNSRKAKRNSRKHF